MSSLERFAYPVPGIEDLARPVRAALEAQLRPGETARQIIFAPGQDQPVTSRRLRDRLSAWLSWQRTPEWVLLLTDERLLVAASPEGASSPQITMIPLADLLWLELGTILLHSWVAWSWASAGRSQEQRIYFNTVRDDLFWELVNTMRRAIIGQSGRPQPQGDRDFAAFAGLPFKFRNLIPLRVLFPGEQAQAVVYQPALWRRRLGVFRQQRAPTTVVALTRDHLVVAQDDLSNVRAAYGLIARYCPRDRVRGATLERAPGDLWLNVTLGLGETEQTLRLLFEPRAESALQDLVAAMRA